MIERNTLFSTFSLEREYAHSPARVFAAWADPEAKQRWFACHDDWKPRDYRLDFRAGGREHLVTVASDGVAHIYDAVYFDIVPNERVIYSYDMHLDDQRISVSLTTVEFKVSRKGTRLVFTEQGVFLDGQQIPADREGGTGSLLDNLGKELAR